MKRGIKMNEITLTPIIIGIIIGTILAFVYREELR
jgi:hypothetical protein